MDLLIIFLLTLIAAPVGEFVEWVRVFLLLFPGYVLMIALFPHKDSLQGVERTVLTLVLSFAIVTLVGLVFNYTTWGITLTPIFVAVVCLILVLCLIAHFRRRALPSGEQYKFPIHIERIQWGSANKLDKVLYIGLAIAVIGALGTLVHVITEPKDEQIYTDFYILGSEGMMENYPQEVVLGEQAEITLGIRNHENRVGSYTVAVILNGEKVLGIGPISITDKEQWREDITLVPTRIGEDQKVEFLLYKGEGAEPYQELHLWLDVEEER